MSKFQELRKETPRYFVKLREYENDNRVVRVEGLFGIKVDDKGTLIQYKMRFQRNPYLDLFDDFVLRALYDATSHYPYKRTAMYCNVLENLLEKAIERSPSIATAHITGCRFSGKVYDVKLRKSNTPIVTFGNFRKALKPIRFRNWLELCTRGPLNASD